MKVLRTHLEMGSKFFYIFSGEDRWMGVDCINNSIKNTFQSFIWEPTVVKENALESATEVAFES